MAASAAAELVAPVPPALAIALEAKAKETDMAGAAHLGVALAAKRVAPRTPLWVLVLGSYLIDLVFMAFVAAGKERMPGRLWRAAPAAEGVAPAAGGSSTAPSGDAPAADIEAVCTNPWSHGLLMALVWTVLSALVATRLSRSGRTGVFFGLLVFGHWIVDFVSKPMAGVFPRDTGLPLLVSA